MTLMHRKLSRGLLAGLLAISVNARAADVDCDTELCAHLTITPFQTATFVGNPEAARLLNELSEFSTRLLGWTDTPREPVIKVGDLVRDGYIPFYREWSADTGEESKIAVSEIERQVSAGFRLLESPRLVRLMVGEESSAGSVLPVDLWGTRPASIPVIVTNLHVEPVDWVLRETGTGRPLHSMRLGPGQTTGFFLDVPVGVSGEAWELTTEADGKAADLALPIRHRGAGSLRVRVVDESGATLAARVYLTGADQRSHAPSGAMQRFVLGDRKQAEPGASYFHTAGSFIVELPAGDAQLEVVKGLEYWPRQQSVTVAPGKTQEIEIKLTRIADLPAAGWYSGDVHVHGNLFSENRIRPADVLDVAKAEDLNVMNILPCNDPRTATISDQQYFTGGPDPVSERNHIVYYNEEMRNDLYGHVGFLNLKTFVEPAYFGWPHSPFPYDAPGNFPQTAAAKAQGAFVSYVHPGLPSEFPVDIALGLADTIDVMSQNDERITLPLWYRLLNCGFRCPASAGTDSFLNIPYHLVPGAGRVYVKTSGEFSYAAWIEGFKRGRTFVSNGPLLQFSFNGVDPGAELIVEDGPLEIRIAGEATSIVPLESVEIVVNGKVVRRIEAGPDRHKLAVDERVVVTESGWIAVRVIGPGHRWVTNDRDLFAHTSPVYLTVGDNPVASPDDARFFSEEIDRLIAKMRAQGKFANEADREAIEERFREAQRIYDDLAERTRSGP